MNNKNNYLSILFRKKREEHPQTISRQSLFQRLLLSFLPVSLVNKVQNQTTQAENYSTAAQNPENDFYVNAFL